MSSGAARSAGVSVGLGVISTATIPASPIVIKGVLRTSGTAGTLQLRWAQNTSNGTGTVRETDSYIKAAPVA